MPPLLLPPLLPLTSNPRGKTSTPFFRDDDEDEDDEDAPVSNVRDAKQANVARRGGGPEEEEVEQPSPWPACSDEEFEFDIQAKPAPAPRAVLLVLLRLMRPKEVARDDECTRIGVREASTSSKASADVDFIGALPELSSSSSSATLIDRACLISITRCRSLSTLGCVICDLSKCLGASGRETKLKINATFYLGEKEKI
jgi:hypothetical protein